MNENELKELLGLSKSQKISTKLEIRNYELEEFPETLWKLTQLEELDIWWCSNLKKLPESIGNLTQLERLRISGCWEIEQLPESIGNLIYLEELILWDYSNLKKIT